MRGPNGGRRRPKDSFVTNAPPPPLPFSSTARDSDVSFCSSRPSTSSIGAATATGRSSIPISDRSYQISAARTVNSYLSSHSLPFTLKSSLPSARDILETLRFALARLDFPSSRLEDDLPFILKHLNFPIKLNKSALRAPGTPHSWPSLLAVIHFLIQVAMYNDHLIESSAAATPFEDNTLFVYAINSYLRYISGDDDAVDALDGELSGKLEQEKESVVENVKNLKRECEELEAKLEGLRSGLSPREMLEQEKAILEADITKFRTVIDQAVGNIATFDKVLEEKAKELEAKEEGRRRICAENEELKKKVAEQKVNLWDAERMKRELQAVESNIEAAGSARNEWEKKTWNLDAPISNKLQEMEELAIECNQAMRRSISNSPFSSSLSFHV